MPVHSKCKLVKKEKLREDIYKFTVESKEIAKSALPRTIFRDKSFRWNRANFKKTNKYI